MSLCLEENSFFYLLLLSRMYFGVCSDSVKTRDFSVLDNYIETVSKKILCLMEKVGGKDDVSGLGIGAPNGNLLPATASVFNVSPVTSAKLLEIFIE